MPAVGPPLAGGPSWQCSRGGYAVESEESRHFRGFRGWTRMEDAV